MVQSLYPINRMWWCITVLLTLEKAEGLKFKVILSYISILKPDYDTREPASKISGEGSTKAKCTYPRSEATPL